MKKKLLCMSVVIALIAGQLYAIDISIGISSPGYGVGVLRGENGEDFVNIVDAFGFKEDTNLSFFPMAQFNLLFEFSPYLGLETGIGYGRSILTWSRGEAIIDLYRDGLIIPLMGRSQFSLGIFNFYVMFGPKFVIPLKDEYYTRINQDGTTDSANNYEENRFTMDLGFALGSEIKLGSLFLGLRVGYDFNVVSPVKAEQSSGADVSWYHDVFCSSITLRYAL